jgi:hypothetical protein
MVEDVADRGVQYGTNFVDFVSPIELVYFDVSDMNLDRHIE